jgi:hypothetical protein|tara:strand:- start:1366 stop:1746 length:381 start_codon:yes stop_codon:yes gene_type:complete
MAAISDYLENKLLDHVMRNTAYSSPSDVYLALFTSNPTDAGTGTQVSGGSYARQAIICGASSSGTISNSAEISFTSMPAVTVTHIGVYDASTSGNLLFHGALSSSKSVDAGDTFKIAVGDLDISLD